MLYRNKPRFVEVEYFNGTNLPDHLRYSKSNPTGVMDVPYGIQCRRCNRPSHLHKCYHVNGSQVLICPDSYLLIKGNKIIEVLGKDQLEQDYILCDVEDIYEIEDSDSRNRTEEENNEESFNNY